MSFSTGGGSGPVSEINVTPLVDVMLVLLIIFMVTAPLMQQGIKVDLPNADTPPMKTSTEERLVLTLTKDGKAYLGKRVMMHWPTQKFVLGSYTCPLIGQVTTMLEHCATPELDGSLLFAGEHTSADSSGFMSGAVESGNRVAKEVLGEG